MQQTQRAAGDSLRSAQGSAEATTSAHHDAAAAAENHHTERLQLMAAAEHVLERGGWWGFKLESVLRQARLSTRSFYRHFDGKDDLLSALLEGELLAIADYLKSLGGDASSPVDRVWLYIDALIDLSFDQRIIKPASLFALHWRKLLPEYSEVVQRCAVALTAPLAEALDEGHRLGNVACADPAAEAKAIFFLISSTVFDRPNVTGQDARALAEHIILPFVARALRVTPRRTASRRSLPAQPARPHPGPAGLQFTLARYAWEMTDCAS
ncbi:TetR/AcrR family transcriptional regulator [Mycobacterium sp.]|uniref:TetR/AcrR family transcriptional regulator n=1 Tax=Mycobacterium sp. TaxID=1785 RepID=UPI003F9A77ED